MKKETKIILLSLAVLALWIYVVFYKITDFRDFTSGIHRQPIPGFVQQAVIWLLPPIETMLILLFLKKRWRIYGFLLSALLLTIFTFYISFGLAGAFGKLPCGCGGLIKDLSLSQHIIFNLVFASLSVLGFVLCYENSDTSHHLFLNKKKKYITYTPQTESKYFFNQFLTYLFKTIYPLKFALFPRSGNECLNSYRIKRGLKMITGGWQS